MLRLSYIDHRIEATARRVHAVQMLAYRQEAQLLGAIYFPPLERTVRDIQESEEEFCCAYCEDQLVAALSTWPDQEGHGVNIASLVVHPEFQRRGIGRELMTSTVERHGSVALTVQTGAKNTPALALYGLYGFSEYRRWFVGSEHLELVKLRRLPAAKNAA